MRIPKMLLTIAMIICVSTAAAFAAPDVSSPSNTDTKQKSDTLKNEKKSLKDKEQKHKCCKEKWQEFRKDPIKALESKKERIQTQLKEGKITKEKADAINTKLDAKIKEINEFNKLPLKEKKAKLIDNFKIRLDNKVKNGKIDQKEMDELIKKFTKNVENWDGNGFPELHIKGLKPDKDNINNKKD